MKKKDKLLISKEINKMMEKVFSAWYYSCLVDNADSVTEKKKVVEKYKDEKDNLINLFININPLLSKFSASERMCLEKLFNVYWVDETSKMVNDSISIQWKPFAPVITKPSELLTKVAKLENYFIKNS